VKHDAPVALVDHVLAEEGHDAVSAALVGGSGRKCSALSHKNKAGVLFKHEKMVQCNA
jgi:hypothetical protein